MNIRGRPQCSKKPCPLHSLNQNKNLQRKFKNLYLKYFFENPFFVAHTL